MYCGGKYVVLLVGRVPEGGHIIHPASDHIRTSHNQDSANVQTRKHFQVTDSANAKYITSGKEKAISPLPETQTLKYVVMINVHCRIKQE